MPDTVSSTDECQIAYERHGSGPALVVVLGAFGDRTTARRLVPALSSSFTLYCYDRRGRGDSDDVAPYAVQREVDDLDALVTAIGEPALIYGHSSGAALSLEAAARGVAIAKLAVYEPPYVPGAAASFAKTLADLVAAGHESEAVERFMLNNGAPQSAVDGMRASPWWSQAKALAPTLSYDVLLCNDGVVPVQRLAAITCPTLAMAGSRSPDAFEQAARSIATAVPAGTMRVVPDQDHGIPPEVVGPILEEFLL